MKLHNYRINTNLLFYYICSKCISKYFFHKIKGYILHYGTLLKLYLSDQTSLSVS